MGKLQEGHVFGKDQEFSFEHVTFEMVVRQRQPLRILRMQLYIQV